MIDFCAEFVLIAIAKPGFGLNEEDFKLVLRKFASTSHSSIRNEPFVKIIHFNSALKTAELIERAKEVSKMLNNMQVNVLEKKIYDCPKRLIVFDMDSTLIQGEVIDEIASQSPKASFIHHLTEKARNGEIEFKDAIIKRVELLSGMSIEVLESVRKQIKLTEGAREIISHCKQVKGMKIALVSGGFNQFTDWLKETLALDYAFSNLLEEFEGCLTGRVLGKIVDRAEKENIARNLAAELGIGMENVVAVGDGANDLDMINASGIGIAFNAKGIENKQFVPSIDAFPATETTIEPRTMLSKFHSLACAKFFQRTYTSIPFVIDKSSGGGVERSYDIYSRLLRDRIIFMAGPINELSSNSIVAQLLYLESQAPSKPIQMYINSPGGSVYDAFAIYDTMRYISAPVHTFCIGLAASAGSLLLAAGERGKRFALQNSRIMVHQPSGGASGQASDVAILAQEILRIRSQLNGIYAEHTGQSIDVIEKYMERDSYLDANEALKFGIIDTIIRSRNELVAV